MEEEKLYSNFRLNGELDDFNLKDSEGNNIPKSKEYLEERAKKEITCNEKCSIGDIVILKVTNQLMKVTGVDVKINDNFNFDYSGIDMKESNDREYFFNQDRISTIIKQKHR